MTYIDGLGRIYTTGYNAEGELGNANTQSTFGPKYQPSLLGDYRFIPSENIVNLKKGESQSDFVLLLLLDKLFHLFRLHLLLYFHKFCLFHLLFLHKSFLFRAAVIVFPLTVTTFVSSDLNV